jgi:SprT protein
MIITLELKNQINQNLKTKIEQTKENFKKAGYSIDEMKLPVISYDLKGQVAGNAIFSKNMIKINKEILLMPENTEEQSTDTLYHELGHIITDYLVHTNQIKLEKDRMGRNIRIKPHGKEWKKVMKLLNEKDEVTHKMKIPSQSRRKKRITYVCDCQEHEMTKQAHEKMQNKYKKYIYTCKSCKGFLRLKEGAKLRYI